AERNQMLPEIYKKQGVSQYSSRYTHILIADNKYTDSSIFNVYNGDCSAANYFCAPPLPLQFRQILEFK
ncbi:MAG: hypothetical protein ABIO19_13965, partial [Burkholderiaceae bacterium]